MRVISAAGREGEMTVWIAPTKGFNALKWTYHKIPQSQNAVGGGTLAQIGIDDSLVVVDSVEVQQVQGRWLAVAGRYTQTTHFDDGEVKVSRVTVRRTDIETNVDFAKLDAFRLWLPDGSVVTNSGVPGVFFEFRNGKMLPKVDNETIAEIDKQVKFHRRDRPARAVPSARPFAPTVGATTKQQEPPAQTSAPPAQATRPPDRRRGGAAIVAALAVVLALSAAVVRAKRRGRSRNKSPK